jgi:type IV secretion system protein VirB9
MNACATKAPYSRLVAVRLLGVHVMMWAGVHLQAMAEIVPGRGSVDARVRSANYDSQQVYRIRAFVGYQLDVQFEPGESFVGIGAGDIEGLSFASQDNHLFLKPKAENVATNLTILTNRRVYQIDYSVETRRPTPSESEIIYALRFLYPQGEKGGDLNPPAWPVSKSENANRDYWYCGHPAIRPQTASDDGVHTRLSFDTKGEQPAIFVENDDGSESLLNFSMEGPHVLLHRVARRLVVRRGRLVGHIWNRHFTGEGEWLRSGTVSPDVQREAPLTPP